MPEPHTTLDGRYRLESVLGAGGAAEVWQAVDLSTGEHVAIKRLMSSCDDEGARLRREARLLEELSHPGIARLRGTGVVDGRPYLVLDLIPGRTVADHLEAGGPMETVEVRDLAAQLARALAYAHSRGVIHRDVKPGNVMITPEGRAVLVDFGVGRMVGESCIVTQVGLVTGTIAYLSPEQAAGETVTAATDIYSLGLVLAEAATGHRVFQGTPTEVTAARMAGDAPLPPEVEPALRSLVAPMTRLDPGRRPTAPRVIDLASADPSEQPTTVQRAVTTAEMAPVERPPASPAGAPAARPALGGLALATLSGLGDRLAGWRRATQRALDRTGDDAGRIDEQTSGVHLAAAATMAGVLSLGALVGGASSSSGATSAETTTSTTVATTTTTTTIPPPPPEDKDEDEDGEDDERGDGAGNRGRGNHGQGRSDD